MNQVFVQRNRTSILTVQKASKNEILRTSISFLQTEEASISLEASVISIHKLFVEAFKIKIEFESQKS